MPYNGITVEFAERITTGIPESISCPQGLAL
jgi:hypothetical protein